MMLKNKEYLSTKNASGFLGSQLFADSISCQADCQKVARGKRHF